MAVADMGCHERSSGTMTATESMALQCARNYPQSSISTVERSVEGSMFMLQGPNNWHMTAVWTHDARKRYLRRANGGSYQTHQRCAFHILDSRMLTKERELTSVIPYSVSSSSSGRQMACHRLDQQFLQNRRGDHWKRTAFAGGIPRLQRGVRVEILGMGGGCHTPEAARAVQRLH